MDLVDICRSFHSRAIIIYIPLFSTWNILQSKLLLRLKGKFRKIQIISYIFSDNKGNKKLEVRKKSNNGLADKTILDRRLYYWTQQNFEEELTVILFKLFPNIEQDGTLSNPFYNVCITLKQNSTKTEHEQEETKPLNIYAKIIKILAN